MDAAVLNAKKAHILDTIIEIYGPQLFSGMKQIQPEETLPQTMTLKEVEKRLGVPSHEWMIGRPATRTRPAREGFLPYYRHELEEVAVHFPSNGEKSYVIFTENFIQFYKDHVKEFETRARG